MQLFVWAFLLVRLILSYIPKINVVLMSSRYNFVFWKESLRLSWKHSWLVLNIDDTSQISLLTGFSFQGGMGGHYSRHCFPPPPPLQGYSRPSHNSCMFSIITGMYIEESYSLIGQVMIYLLKFKSSKVQKILHFWAFNFSKEYPNLLNFPRISMKFWDIVYLIHSLCLLLSFLGFSL